MLGESSHQTGLKLFEEGQYQSAAREFERALREEETSERWKDWASAELACGRAVRAEWGYRRALHLDPSNRQAAVNLAVLLIVQRRLQDCVPILRPHAHSLSESEKTILTNLLTMLGGRGVAAAPPPPPKPQLLLDAFLTVISLIPHDDPGMPADLRKASRRTLLDSRHYVKQCCELLNDLPLEVQSLAIGKLREMSKDDYRLLLVLACHYLTLDEPRTALSLARDALNRNRTITMFSVCSSNANLARLPPAVAPEL
jgi:tetratricopeptide (TPR) repeat protein